MPLETLGSEFTLQKCDGTWLKHEHESSSKYAGVVGNETYDPLIGMIPQQVRFVRAAGAFSVQIICETEVPTSCTW